MRTIKNMTMPFVNILVPVNLHQKDDRSVEIAIQMADPGFSVIHLVAVIRTNILFSALFGSVVCLNISGIGYHRFVKSIVRMSELKAMIKTYRPAAIVKIHICRSHNIQHAIEWYAHRLATQVIILADSEINRKCFFGRIVSPEKIASGTGCKVLNYKQGVISFYEKYKIVKYTQFDRKEWTAPLSKDHFTNN